MKLPHQSPRDLFLLSLVVGVATLAVWGGHAWWTWKQWFAIQKQQMATIERFEEYPPSGQESGWSNDIVTLHNVWGNATYTPSYSNLSITTMHSLQLELDRILNATSRENSVESVDRVYTLLLTHGKHRRFTSGYHDEFREAHGLPAHPTVDQSLQPPVQNGPDTSN